MKPRNFVAKYAPTSGAGKHKRKDRKKMASYDKEDWVYIEDHNKQVEYLEDRKRELEQVIEDMDYDARYILALVLGLKQRAVDQKYWDIVGQCDYIIDLHTAMDHVEALKILKSDAEA